MITAVLEARTTIPDGRWAWGNCAQCLMEVQHLNPGVWLWDERKCARGGGIGGEVGRDVSSATRLLVASSLSRAP